MCNKKRILFAELIELSALYIASSGIITLQNEMRDLQMSNVNRILSVVLVVVSALCIASCSKEQAKSSMNYERPVTIMARAIDSMDTEAYLNCFTYGAKHAYMDSKDFDSNLAEKLLPSNETPRIIKAKVVSYKELESADIDDLKKQYKEKYKMRIEFSKARTLTVEVGTIYEGNEQIDTREMIVIQSDNRWQIFGDVIKKFDFKKK